MVEFLIKMAVILCSLYQTSNAGSALMSSTGDGLACPNISVVFICSVNRSSTLWELDPPPGAGVVTGQVTQVVSSATTELLPIGVERFMFQAARTEFSSNSITSTLTTVTEVSLLNGTVVRCIGRVTESLTIIVAEQPTSPSAPVVISQQNQPSSSIITLEWDPPFSTGGVSVSYILTISPIPLSGSPVTVVTTSTQTTLSYNTPYTVAIRADNCAGSSSDVMVTIPSTVTCLSNPTPANRVTIIDAPPLPALEGSTLNFTCNGQTVSTNCDSDGRWSPDPTTYNCPSVITCSSPDAPSRGNVEVRGRTPPFSLGLEVTYHCDAGLFPPDVRISTCTDVGGRGEWVENPGSLMCRETPANCTVPEEPSNGTIVNYYVLMMNETVLTYQCDNGLSLTGPNTITCVFAGVWSTEPEAIMCGPPAATVPSSIGPIIGGVFGGILVVVCLIAIVVIALCLLRRQKSDELNENVVVEMSGLQRDYSELRHDGPRNAKKPQPPPPDSEGYSRVNRSPDAGALTYDEVVLNSDNKIGVNSEGYSTMNTGQTQRLPGYGQLGNVATVEPVVYAALSSSQPHKKGSNTTATVDQHQVTYATVDVAATSRKQAKAATLPTSPTASAPALPNVDKLLDIDQALVQIRSMEHKWRELAETMRVPETMIEQIEDSCGINHSGCLTEVIDQWMRNCSGRPTWRELAGHLHNIGEEQLSQELLNIYNTGRLPVELNMKAVPSTVYKYDRAPPPPLPSRSPTMTDDSPGQSKTLPPSRPPKAEMTPVRPPKPIPKDESPLPPRPPKHYAKH